MSAKKTWGEALQAELQTDPEYLTELLVLRVNGTIRRRMREIGMKQADLAEKLGVSQPYVSKLLNYNRNLTLRSLAVIAHALDAVWVEPQLVPNEFDYDSNYENDFENGVIFSTSILVSGGKCSVQAVEPETKDKERLTNALALADAA